MLFQILSALVGLFGYTLIQKAPENEPPQLSESLEDEDEDGGDVPSAVIHVDFVAGKRIEFIKDDDAGPDERDRQTKGTKVTIELSPHLHTRLHFLKRLSGAHSLEDSVQHALRVHDAYVCASASGKEVGYYDDQDWIALRIPLP